MSTMTCLKVVNTCNTVMAVIATVVLAYAAGDLVIGDISKKIRKRRNEA